MVYTGHKNRKMPDGKTLVQWLRPSVIAESKFYHVEMPTDEQIAIVASAMRMHHLIEHAADYDFSELGKPNEVTKFWPMQSSIGRFFRDASQLTLDRINIGERDEQARSSTDR